MLTPEQLQRMPKQLMQIMEDMEADVLADICRRLKLSGTVTESALHQMRMLAEQGYSQQYIEKRIRQAMELGRAEIDAMFDEAVQRNEEFLKRALDKQDITTPQRNWKSALDNQVEAIRKQTHDEFRNITQSMGFAIHTGGVKPKFYGVAQVYQRALDRVTMEVATGTIDYNTAIRNAVTDLARSGLQYVNYASGHRDHADVAVRRAVMTGVTQCAGRMSETAMDLLGTRYVEVEAHSGARDTGTGYFNHKSWQGKWYYWSLHEEPDPLGKYDDFIRTTGYGEGGGLCGWNCRHLFYAVIPGLDEPKYTQQQLDNIDPPPFEWNGKEYTAFTARQKQREDERKMRKCKRLMIAHNAAGNEDDYSHYKARLKKLSKEYKLFSAKAGLPLQMNRAVVKQADSDSMKKALEKKAKREARQVRRK